MLEINILKVELRFSLTVDFFVDVAKSLSFTVLDETSLMSDINDVRPTFVSWRGSGIMFSICNYVEWIQCDAITIIQQIFTHFFHCQTCQPFRWLLGRHVNDFYQPSVWLLAFTCVIESQIFIIDFQLFTTFCLLYGTITMLSVINDTNGTKHLQKVPQLIVIDFAWKVI